MAHRGIIRVTLALVGALLLSPLCETAQASRAQPGAPPDDRQRMLRLLVTSDVPPATQVEAGAEMRANAEAAGDAARQSLALSVECRGLLLQGLMADAAKACAGARSLAGSDDLAIFAAERMSGVLILERGEPLAALPTLLAANAAATRSGDELAIAASLTSLGSAAQLAGVNPDAVDYYFRALAISTRIGADDLSSRIANNLDRHRLRHVGRDRATVNDAVLHDQRRIGRHWSRSERCTGMRCAVRRAAADQLRFGPGHHYHARVACHREHGAC